MRINLSAPGKALTTTLLLASGSAAYAHHSFATFDTNKETPVTGEVMEFHSRIFEAGK